MPCTAGVPGPEGARQGRSNSQQQNRRTLYRQCVVIRAQAEEEEKRDSPNADREEGRNLAEGRDRLWRLVYLPSDSLASAEVCEM